MASSLWPGFPYFKKMNLYWYAVPECFSFFLAAIFLGDFYVGKMITFAGSF